jgi:hypothetical protein
VHKLGRLAWGLRGLAGEVQGSVGVPALWRLLLVISLVYVVVCRLFELAVLFGRGERSKGARDPGVTA